MIGAGLAVIALFGVGIGIGNIFSTLIATVGRNPSVQQRVFPFAIIGFALVEAVGAVRAADRVPDPVHLIAALRSGPALPARRPPDRESSPMLAAQDRLSWRPCSLCPCRAG